MRAGIVFVALIALLAAGPSGAADTQPARLGVDAAIEPGAGGTWICTAEVFDLETGDVVITRRFVFSDGEVASTAVFSGGEGIKLEVVVDREEQHARVTLSVGKDSRALKKISQLKLRLK